MLNKSGVLNRFSIVQASALALAIVAFASSATASGPFKWHPAPNTFTLSGVVQISQSITILCDVRIDISVDANGHATVTGRTLSNTSPGTSPLCGGVIQPFGTWLLEADSITQAAIWLGIASVLGQCFGELVGAWNNANSTLTLNNAPVPGTPGPCFVTGTLISDDPNVEIK